jgi:nitroreductase
MDQNQGLGSKFIPLSNYRSFPIEEMRSRSGFLYELMRKRRTVRHFSDKPVPRDVIEACLLTAGTAPNGANIQPWHFVVVTDPKIKHLIREGAEKEEREFYFRRAPEDWLEALEPFGTNWEKPYLDIAPILIAIFAERYGYEQGGSKKKHYYVQESVGIATGMLITAVHYAGLVSLTHTPSPMEFLNAILGRPENEKPFLLLVVGYPSEDALVPEISKKSLEEITTFM